jgi:hypothetical protein
MPVLAEEIGIGFPYSRGSEPGLCGTTEIVRFTPLWDGML